MLLGFCGLCLGCGPKGSGAARTPADLAAQANLGKIHVKFQIAADRFHYSLVVGTEPGHLIVHIPAYQGGSSPRGWTDAEFKRAVPDLRNLQSLDYLMLRLTQITDDSMSEIASLKQLRHLNLGNTAVTDEGLAPLGSLPNLVGLYFEGAEHITGAGLRPLASGRLSKLSLRVTPTTDDGIKSIQEIISLEHLDLGYTGVTDKALVGLARLSKLRTLFIDNTWVTDEGLRELLVLKQLEEINLCKCRGVKGSVVAELCRLPNMKSIDVTGTFMSKEDVAKVRKAFPRVEIIRLYGPVETILNENSQAAEGQ